MGRDDWFRRAAWKDADRKEFHARLRRSRGRFQKAQYLRIQAYHLAEAGLHGAAIELLDQMLGEFPENSELAAAHLQRAECLATLGRLDSAIDGFRAALHAERAVPQWRTNAWVDFGWFVVQTGLTDLYDEVLSLLGEFRVEAGLTFPNIEYRYYAIQAIIADARGERSSAHEFAVQALAEASKEHSGLRYHPKLGLVGSQPNWIEKKLGSLASGT